MTTVFWRSLGIVATASIACAGCETHGRTPPPPRDATPDAITWRSVGTWSGRGNRQTESFTVETGALRLRWETRNERAPGAGTFRVSLHSAISGRPLQTIVQHTGLGADVAYLEDDPRLSYLVIESKDVDWIATLEEAVPTTSSATWSSSRCSGAVCWRTRVGLSDVGRNPASAWALPRASGGS